MVLADINFDGVKSVAEGLGSSAFSVKLDITQAGQWEKALDQAWTHFGQVDVLINNAAIVHTGRAENIPLAQHQQTLNVNFIGPLTGMCWRCCRTALHALARSVVSSSLSVA